MDAVRTGQPRQRVEDQMMKSVKRSAGILLATAAMIAGWVDLCTVARGVEADWPNRTDAVRACTLVLTSDADMGQFWQCVEAIGAQRPAKWVLLNCASTVGWHSQSDGRVAGQKVAECLEDAQANPRG
jgi:hypothetical protein